MNNPLRTPDDYELFIYSLPGQYAGIVRSTVSFVRVGATLAKVTGEIEFEEHYRLMVRERLIYSRLPVVLDWYGYEAWKGAEKLYWYDSQSHPNAPTLRSTDPHHKHIPPNMRHNRIPAPGMSFDIPNLPAVIAEVLDLIKNAKLGKGIPE